MSERATEKWTADVKDAFKNSANAIKGRDGELFFIEVLKSQDITEIQDHASEYKYQISGIDVTFTDLNGHSVAAQVKNNLNEYGVFYVDYGTLTKSKADRFYHVNPATTWVNWYDREAMVDYYNANWPGQEYVRLTRPLKPNFVKWRSYPSVTVPKPEPSEDETFFEEAVK